MMQNLAARNVVGGAMLIALSACAPQTPTGAPTAPVYKGIQTTLLDGDLVQFQVAMTGGAGEADVSAYAACAAAQYALIRGFGFARQVRTNIAFQGGVWRGDAVYTISAALPQGSKTFDAEVTVRDCGARGIPTV